MGDFFRDSGWLVWVGAALVLGVVELASFDFVFSMLVLGALAAAVASLLGLGFAGQAFAFAVVSIVGLLVLRPAIKRWADRSTPQTDTNTDALVGRPAIAVIDVTDRAGQVKLSGETWSARAGDPGAVYPAGVDVTVLRIDGATAIIGPGPAREGTPPVQP